MELQVQKGISLDAVKSSTAPATRGRKLDPVKARDKEIMQDIEAMNKGDSLVIYLSEWKRVIKQIQKFERNSYIRFSSSHLPSHKWRNSESADMLITRNS